MRFSKSLFFHLFLCYFYAYPAYLFSNDIIQVVRYCSHCGSENLRLVRQHNSFASAEFFFTVPWRAGFMLFLVYKLFAFSTKSMQNLVQSFYRCCHLVIIFALQFSNLTSQIFRYRFSCTKQHNLYFNVIKLKKMRQKTNMKVIKHYFQRQFKRTLPKASQ